MHVCARRVLGATSLDGESDPVGDDFSNYFYWINCGYTVFQPNQFFGG